MTRALCAKPSLPFFHVVSTGEEPHHSHCPVGRDSWCFFQWALAMGEEPGAHRDRVGTPLSKEVVEKVKDVYMRLSHPDLMEHCLKVETQNANESLYAKIWANCPKTGFVGLTHVVAAMCSAVAEFNQGGRVDGDTPVWSYGNDQQQRTETFCCEGR